MTPVTHADWAYDAAYDLDIVLDGQSDVERIAAVLRKVVADEREACARLVDGYAFKRVHSELDQAELAAAIRARKGE